MRDDPSRLVRFDEFELDERNALLTRAGRAIALPPKAFAVLCELTRQPGKLTRKEELLDAVWGHRHVSESVLKTTISQLRSALSDDASQPRYIETASRRGYRFIGKVGAISPGSLMQPARAVTPTTIFAPAAATANATTAPAVPAQPLVAPEAIAPMIGREPALAQLHAAWRRVIGGQRSVFWIAGDAGIGKTTLVEQFLRELGDVLVVRGQCVEQYGTGEPYLPLLEALGALCRKHPELATMMRAIAPTWLVQLPWLIAAADRTALNQELSGANQERKVRELAELMSRFTEQHPLIVLTEDLHWSDSATLRLLDHFARNSAPSRLLWIGTFRLTQVIADAHPLKELRQELRLHRLCEEVVLEPFSEVEVAEYLERRLPQAATHEVLVQQLHEHTGGLPLFLVNVVDHLGVDELASMQARKLARATWSVPDNLAGAIQKRIERLPMATQRLLEAASVCGVEFRSTVLAEVLQQDAHAVMELCDELAQQQYWLRHLDMSDLTDGTLDARYSFRHALYRHVFYQRQGAAVRVQLHRRVAAALERNRARGITATAAELASHHEAGLAHAAALRSYADAARSALSHFAPIDAIDITAHALTLLPRCPEGAERLELEFSLMAHRGVACSQQFGLVSKDAEVAYRRALELADMLPPTAARAQVLTGLAWMYYMRAEYADARALAERLQAFSASHNDPVLVVSACGILGVILTMQAEFDAARRYLERGIDVCQALGEEIPYSAFVADPLVVLRANIAVALLHLGLIDQAVDQMDQALRRAHQRGQPMAKTIALWCAAMFEMRMRHPERVAEYARSLGKLVSDNALVQAHGPSLWIRGWAEAYLGSPSEGIRLILEGFEFNRRLGMISGGAEVLAYAVEAHLCAGDWNKAQAQLDEARPLAQQRGERILFPYHYLLQARIDLGRGSVSAARSTLQAGLAVARTQGSLWMQVRLLTQTCELPDCTAEDLQELQRAYQQLPEGFGTAPIEHAHQLLASARLQS